MSNDVNGLPISQIDDVPGLTAALTSKADATTTTAALALKANLASPTFTGVPAGPTATAGTNTTQFATTAFVTGGLALKAPLASPTFTGTARFKVPNIGTNIPIRITDSTGADVWAWTYKDSDGTLTISSASGYPFAFSGGGVYVGTATPGSADARLEVKAKDASNNAFAAYSSDGSKAFVIGPTASATAPTFTATTGFVGPGSGITGITQSQVASLTTDLAAKAPLASPALTGAPTAPTATAGDNSTKIATTAYVDSAVAAGGGGGGGGSSLIFVATASKTVANTTTETTLLSTGVGSATLAANTLAVGKTYRVRARGVYGTAASGPGAITIRVKIGSTIVASQATQGTSLVNRGWSVEADVTCRTTGASGTVIGQGWDCRATSATAAAMIDMETATAITVDTTTSNNVDVTVQFATADSLNTITCTNLTIEALN